MREGALVGRVHGVMLWGSNSEMGNVVMKFCTSAVLACVALAFTASVSLAQTAAPASTAQGHATLARPAAAAPAKPALDAHTQEDIARHQGMANAHAQAAQCLASGQSHEACQKQLQASCKGLALGKHCGLRHAH